ncbi:MAG: hypothetical protein WD273_05530 [Trueperaceae bacterium]
MSERLESGQVWSDREWCEALELAEKILRWGRVPQRNYDACTVEAVFQCALTGNLLDDARMNSGWTKVAAFATAHREDDNELYPHTIWDSRVSTSVVSRLDDLLAADGVDDPRELFPGVGIVPGRGGRRERLELELRWPNVYRRWSGHFAGSALVKELRDLLNEGEVPHADARWARNRVDGNGRWQRTFHGRLLAAG